MLGDFNADMNRDSYNSSIMYNFVESKGLHFVPHGDTYHLRTSSSFLDLYIIDDRSKLVDYRQHQVNFLSAHDLIYIIYRIKVVGIADQ